MQPSEYFEIFQQIFSQDGLTVGPLRIQCPEALSVQIESVESGIKMIFSGHKPKVTLQKIITFSVSVNGIHFSRDGGVLELDHFPDLPFSYNQILK
jgi:hypothetical protein